MENHVVTFSNGVVVIPDNDNYYRNISPFKLGMDGRYGMFKIMEINYFKDNTIIIIGKPFHDCDNECSEICEKCETYEIFKKGKENACIDCDDYCDDCQYGEYTETYPSCCRGCKYDQSHCNIGECEFKILKYRISKIEISKELKINLNSEEGVTIIYN